VITTREVIKEMIKEEVEKLFGEASSISFDDVPEIAEDEIVECELTEDMMAGSGGFKKRLRKQGGKLVVVKKRKKKLPLHLRKIKPTQAKRIARKSAIKRKGKQARISKKAAKTTKKGRARGLYKVK
jgi:hypothetical protein|tara:strand:- start:1882 stop:2262 length:381 start_codon:yes stop_codon:yes gene_type:complete